MTIELNLPPFAYKVTQIGEKPHIYDVVRRKYVLITPEEWVRQHLLHLLLNQYQYPKALIRAESGLRYNKLAKRTDLVVYDRAGLPFLLVECKAASVKLCHATFEQAVRYNAVLKARYLLISNGLEHRIFELLEGAEVKALDDLPPFLGE
jgi:hypothetical protein